mgnify:CR=1 FL=1
MRPRSSGTVEIGGQHAQANLVDREEWHRKGKPHRENAPAIIHYDPETGGVTSEEYWLNGNLYISEALGQSGLDNGVRVMVPPHITSGTRIVVHVYDREYVRRAD